jgi:ribosome biogenesis GTPase / thiamine phosphate phosphatase
MARQPKRKVRVDFRQNRQSRRRSDDWTRQYRAEDAHLDETDRTESVRAKGDLSRKRTIIVDDRDLPAVDEALWCAGTITRVHGLICYVTAADGRSWECTVRRVLRTRLIESRAPVTVGDQVWFSDQSKQHDGAPVGVIERVAPRTTILARRDRRQRAHTIVANADQLLAVVSVAQPRLRPHLVDRYIVAACKGGLRPILCFNKIDLLAPDSAAESDEDEERGGLMVSDIIAEFRELGYACLCTSALSGAGLPELGSVLQGHMTVLSGQSGVGKSSLLNALQPALALPTSTVSAENEKGRHTTTLATVWPLDGGGFVVDTPGIRAFDLWSVAPGELEACFVEFIPLVPQCRFGDCSHRYEEGCAVIAAVADGVISARRYYSYLKMFAEV